MINLGEYILRKPETKDAKSVFTNYAQDKEVTKYLIWSPHRSLSDSEQWIQYCIAKFDLETNLKYVICEAQSDEAIGMIDATVHGHEAVVGYVLSRRFWGRGIMTKALSALSKELLSRPSIYRVYATHDIENPASGRVMEKAGMKFEGILRRSSMHPNVSSEPRDSKLYAIVK